LEQSVDVENDLAATEPEEAYCFYSMNGKKDDRQESLGLLH
jgi:hypothetical protein